MRTALHDALVEETLCALARITQAHFAAATRLSIDHHVVRVTAEARNVLLYPLHRRNQVEITNISRLSELITQDAAQIAVSEDVQSMIDGSDDDIAATRQSR